MLKKKIILSVFTFVFLCCALFLVSCEQVCVHEWSEWNTSIDDSGCIVTYSLTRECKNCYEIETVNEKSEKHDYAEATCEKPKTCIECGKTEGSALNHVGGYATCIQKPTCTKCKKQYGEYNKNKHFPHKIISNEYLVTEATCTSPATYHYSCKWCGEILNNVYTYGAAGHLYGPWILDESGMYIRVCTRDNKHRETMKVSEKPGDVFHIYAWNEEFKEFFEMYVSDEKQWGLDKYHLDGTEVKWTIVPSTDGSYGSYQNLLDLALKSNAAASDADKVDMFLAGPDYIKKYADSKYTQDITKIGVTNFDNVYNYTKEAASDINGVIKGVSFQCCPSVLIYNRVVAKALWGTDDPTEVSKKLDTWEKFDAVAAEAKAKGYYMIACEAETYRAFSNNTESAWVDENDNLKIPEEIEQWMDQADEYVKKGYTIAADVWSADKVANLKADVNNTLCCFGPAWYYNFCMGDSKKGDWGIVEGPMAHFWGGTWLMAATGSDNTDLVAKTMNAFINDEEVCSNLIKEEGQFTNNQMVNEDKASFSIYTINEFLGEQKDYEILCEVAKKIKFQNTTIYDQLCNEGIQQYYREYLTGAVDSKDKAIDNFYKYIKEKYPNLNISK